MTLMLLKKYRMKYETLRMKLIYIYLKTKECIHNPES